MPSDLTGVRIGLPPASWERVDEQIAARCSAALDLLVDRGATVVEVPPPPLDRPAVEVFDVISEAEALHVHRDWLAQADRYTPQVLRRVRSGEGISAAAYLEARRHAHEWAGAWRRLCRDRSLTALAHPAIDAPPPVVEPDGPPLGPRIRLSLPWSLTGFPALSVPVGLDRRGLPVGLSLAAPPEQEGPLVGLGTVVDEEIGFWRSAPPVR